MRFNDDSEFRFTQYALTATGGYSFASGWSVRGAIGAVLGGGLEGAAEGGSFEMAPGLVGAITGSRQWTFGAQDAWFVTGSMSVSVAATGTTAMTSMEEADLLGVDARIGAIAGRTLFDVWSPYLLARGFGGPVLWTVADQDITGSDTRHFQLGVGSSVTTDFGLTVVADVSVLGERSASLGISWRL